MTREQIEKAALLFAGAGEFGECPYNPDAKNGFMAGAQWRINSVWHDASEEPEQENEPILVEYKAWGFECSYYTVCDDIWDYRTRLKRDDAYCTILRWAYIKDLIPEIKEEME
ncbi:MAG: hypothetical protein IAB08_07735 [Bacteroidetes bacterium]|uniref:Phage protein n=1 Tax=Candidatus Pullibacteroides excrementavium TaxID=2840905 RepID=A0A9D9DW11_9BACT|nr:hypothetical protein [Candidatus Pullibacteroides excrementavium]